MSTPILLFGRSITWPTDAFTTYPGPRYFLMVFALAGDSTTTSVLDRPRAPDSAEPLAFLAAFRAFVVFAAALLFAMFPSGRRKMPALPNGFESSAAQEVFPGPLHHHALQLELRKPSERFPGGDLRAAGEVVYMNRGPLVQKSPQFDDFRIEDPPVRTDGRTLGGGN